LVVSPPVITHPPPDGADGGCVPGLVELVGDLGEDLGGRLLAVERGRSVAMSRAPNWFDLSDPMVATELAL
jgi:hypothetical protein